MIATERYTRLMIKMVKRSKIQTPEWVLKGYKSEKEYLSKTGKKKQTSGKVYKIKECPKCKSRDVFVSLGAEEGKGKGEWECKKCRWKGRDVFEKEVSEDEFLDYMESKGEDN